KDADDHLAAGHGIDDFTPLPEAGINQPADFASAVAVAAGVERGELSHLDPGSLAPPWDRVANLAQKSAGEYEGSVDGLLSWLMPGWCESVGSSHGHISEELRRARSSLNGAATSDYMREAAAAATVGPWTPPSILDGVDLDAPPPAPEILGLIYPEKLHLVSGRPEAAKTWLALALGVEATRNGGALLIIDTDGTGQRDLAHRLRGLGLDSDALADVAYTDSPREVFAAENLPGLQGWIRERATRGPVIVVIDSANPTLAALSYRLDEEGMSQLEAAAIKPLKAAGATVLLIDHIAIHADRDSPYSIGTQRKHAAADVHLRLDSIGEPLTRGGQPSTFAIRGMKDRPGGIERHGQQRHVGRVTFTPGPGGAVSYSIELGPPTAGEQRATWRPTRLMERVSAWAANQPGAFSKRTAESEVSGKGEAIRAAIDALYAEGYLTASGDKWKHAQTYREADDPEAEE
ncbi:MAG: AAA family ATPase, partial [Thermoleophilia bacterium]